MIILNNICININSYLIFLLKVYFLLYFLHLAFFMFISCSYIFITIIIYFFKFFFSFRIPSTLTNSLFCSLRFFPSSLNLVASLRAFYFEFGVEEEILKLLELFEGGDLLHDVGLFFLFEDDPPIVTTIFGKVTLKSR